jgi:CheY-like chemotaxis protein
MDPICTLCVRVTSFAKSERANDRRFGFVLPPPTTRQIVSVRISTLRTGSSGAWARHRGGRHTRSRYRHVSATLPRTDHEPAGGFRAPVPKGTLFAANVLFYIAIRFPMSDSRNMYVAVVDDDESLCRSLARLLRASGIRAVTYLSAEAFLDDTRRREFDCLVLDIQLGGISGIELNQRLAASDSTTPVIFLTAYDEPDVLELALRTPCAAYLRKTEPAEVVLGAIRQAVTRHGARSHQTPAGEDA